MLIKIVSIFLYLAICTVDPFIWIHSYYTILTPKCNDKKYYLGAFLGLYFIIIGKQGMTFLGINEASMLVFPIMFIYIIIVSRIIFQGSTRTKIFLLIVVYGVSIVIDCVVGGLCLLIKPVSMEHFTEFGVENLAITISARLLNLLLYWIGYGMIFQKKRCIRWEYLRPIIILNLFALTPLVVLFYNRSLIDDNSTILLIIIAILLMLEIAVSLYASYTIYQKSALENKAKERIEQMELQLSFYEAITESTNRLRKLRHDIKSHILQISSIAKTEKYVKVEEYIDELYPDIFDSEEVCAIENVFLASIVTQKKKQATRKNIAFTSEITVSKFPFSNHELTSLFSNILDNAIEANEKLKDCQKRFIILEINRTQNELNIICKNAISEKPKRDRNGNFLTSKENKLNHGLGMKIIKDIVDKYNGKMNVVLGSDEFILLLTFNKNNCEEFI
ncbi:sensor histidine kinase [Anaeromicropila populeti]|uniref:GHKL domain-containing protein n=1 Tax=Anaeromicropila populeti TaxID=37658 RepID=A0A1I6LZU2_9FIRM|nr:GHKL domain-containing protein [Anaeromicropila populeti]SFS08933.1 GHKL domain-containing protein [Anaeromicropila populeti]